MTETPLRTARQTMLGTATLTLAGSVVGLTLGRSAGGVTGYEVWLISACLVFSATILGILLIQPFDRTLWTAPVSSTFFLTYLTAGSLLSVNDATIVGSFLVYLLWFYPLLTFNRFVNVTRFSGPLTWVIAAVPFGLISLRALLGPPTNLAESGVLAVYGLTYATFALVLGLFARYREAYIKEQERGRALRATHEAVRASEQQFRLMFDNAASGVGWLSLEGDFLHVNATFGRMVGRSPGELQGRPFQDQVHPEHRQEWAALLAEMQLDRSHDHGTELRLVTADDHTLWTRLSFTRVTTSSDLSEALAFVCLDNTDVHRMEIQLRESQRLEAIGQLTGGVAHDFNNLLTVILGNIELLEETLPPNTQHGGLVSMTRMAAERGARLTGQLLALSRKQPLAPQATDVAYLLNNLQGLLQRSLGEHVEMAVEYDAALWPTLVDPAQLDSTLLNLCINARDAMPGGGRLLVRVSNARLDQAYSDRNHAVSPGDYVLILIADNGIGMTPEVQSHVFDPFFTTKEPGKGTGLGLAMVYGFITQSGGHVSIDSAEGEGTTVRLYLPRHQPPGADAPDTASASRTSAVNRVS